MWIELPSRPVISSDNASIQFILTRKYNSTSKLHCVQSYLQRNIWANRFIHHGFQYWMIWYFLVFPGPTTSKMPTPFLVSKLEIDIWVAGSQNISKQVFIAANFSHCHRTGQLYCSLRNTLAVFSPTEHNSSISHPQRCSTIKTRPNPYPRPTQAPPGELGHMHNNDRCINMSPHGTVNLNWTCTVTFIHKSSNAVQKTQDENGNPLRECRL